MLVKYYQLILNYKSYELDTKCSDTIICNFFKVRPTKLQKVIPTLKPPKYAVSAQVVHLNS